MTTEAPTPETPDERFAIVENHLWHAGSRGVMTEPARDALASLQAELTELRAERDRLRKALEADAADPCDAAAFYGEDGYDKCLDPEYNDMSGNPTLTRCYSCRARAALRSPENPEDG